MSVAMANTRWAHTLVDSLVAGGVAHVVISPGSRNTSLVLACDAHSTLQTHVVLDERAAAFVALGIARASAAPVALVCTSGSAGAHYLPAIIEARYSRIPLVVLTADRPRELQYSGSPQTIDQLQLFGDNVLASFALAAPTHDTSPRWLASVAAQAMDTATSSPAGPVHLNVPFREPLWEADSEPAGDALRPATIDRQPTGPGSELVSELAAQVRDSERGVIVCGPWTSTVDAKDTEEAIGALGAALGWPILADPASGVRYGRHNTDVVLSGYDAFLRSEVVAAKLRPDFVLQFGQVPTSKILTQWLSGATSTRRVLVDPDGWWHDPGHRADRLVVAERDALCCALLAEVPAAPASSHWLTLWQGIEASTWSAIDEQLDATLWEGQVARTLLDTLPEGSALHVASSMPIRDLDGFTPTLDRRLRVLANRGANGIDGTVATAAGESLAWRDGPTAVLLGDLALLHDVSGLIAAIGLGVRMTLVVVDNGGGGIFHHLPIADNAHAFERYFLTPQQSDIVALCRAAGARVTRVDDTALLGPAIGADLEMDGVGVVHITIDRTTNLETHRAAWAAVCDTLTHLDSEDRP
jgi:2-succinyl-5-enolpyruvyl-6-hydroxy-3-cyclohexene-1-carboxylate synthase